MAVNIKKTSRENVVEAELVRQVEALGGVAEKVTVIGKRGFFDRLVVLPGGRIIFVECKRPRGGVVSSHQLKRHATYSWLGAEIAIVKNPGDIERLLLATDSVIKQKAGSR